jgi:hypothetical protein
MLNEGLMKPTIYEVELDDAIIVDEHYISKYDQHLLE